MLHILCSPGMAGIGDCPDRKAHREHAALYPRPLDEPGAGARPGGALHRGDGVARGYLGRPDLSGERFIENPLEGTPKGRLFRTGDRARYTDDGTIEYLGRSDRQAKIHGYRIEPGEVESVLCRAPGVAEAVVLVREDAPGTGGLSPIAGESGGALRIRPALCRS